MGANRVILQRIPTTPSNNDLTYNQKRHLYGLLYKIFVKKDQSLVNEGGQKVMPAGANAEFDREDDPDIRAARDKYV